MLEIEHTHSEVKTAKQECEISRFNIDTGRQSYKKGCSATKIAER